MDWVQENLLAIYAAVVGTIALFLNFGRFWMMRQKSIRKLKVASKIDSQAQERLDDLRKPKDIFDGPGSLVGPIYKVTVINVSHVSMHVDDVGLLVQEGKSKVRLPAYVRHGSHGFLSYIEDAGGEDIAPGAKKTFSIWLGIEPVIPRIIGCYAVSQMGKVFKGKHNPNGQVLIISEIPKGESNKSIQPTATASAD
ncbi:hypothetical protein [Alloalcanivorax venustensis]|uniref:hypothetical protein n=1 Tax=Alloalcanivorax venustensis TaxID=172371 RepID=UPI0035114FAC